MTAKQGGELGCYKKGDLAKEYEAQYWDLPRGGVTKAFLIPTGYEIFKVDDHTKQGLAPLADVKAEIQDILYTPKMEPRIREYLTELRKDRLPANQARLPRYRRRSRPGHQMAGSGRPET